ncbi:MAG: GNAT family N-acetyltransferase [Thermoplasmata archaeon]
MAMEFAIERLDPERLDDLIDAQNAIFADYIVQMRSSRQFFLDFLRSVGGDLANVLVALDGDKIVGYVNPVVDDDEGWIGGIGVRPEYRGKGIGRSLMQVAEEECRKRGVREMSLEVIEGNERAQKLYESLGYVGTRKYVTAEGKPQRHEGFGLTPTPANLRELIAIHERAYRDTCWQRRKVDALIQSTRGAECYNVRGGFVIVRTIDTNGFIPFLGVVPEMRGKGIGTALAKFALTRLWDLGAFKVALYNVNEDLPTSRLLDKFDFKVTMKQLEMRKKL